MYNDKIADKIFIKSQTNRRKVLNKQTVIVEYLFFIDFIRFVFESSTLGILELSGLIKIVLLNKRFKLMVY